MKYSEAQTYELYFGVMFITFLLIFLTPSRDESKLTIKLQNRQWNVSGDVKYSICCFLVPVGLHYIFSSRTTSVGTDTLNYSIMYQSVMTRGILSIEPGYYVLNWLCYNLGMTFNQFLLVVSLIVNVLIFSTLYYYFENKKKSIALGFLVYYVVYFFWSMNIIRQMIAIAIILYGTRFLEKHKYIKFLLFVLLATSFHYSSVVSLLFYVIPLIERGMKSGRKVWYFSAIFILTIGIAPLLAFLAKYITLPYKVSSTYSFGFLIDYIIPLSLIFLVEIRFIRFEDKIYDYLRDIFLLTLPLRTLGYSAPAMMRLAYFSSIVEVLLVPYIIQNCKNKILKNLLYIFVVVGYIILLLGRYLQVNDVFPYVKEIIK